MVAHLVDAAAERHSSDLRTMDRRRPDDTARVGPAFAVFRSRLESLPHGAGPDLLEKDGANPHR